MKIVLFILICLLFSWTASAQMAIHDRAIVAQQERMVYKEWDRNKILSEAKQNPWGSHQPVVVYDLGLAS